MHCFLLVAEDLQIYWSLEAESRYLEIINYLLDHWTIREVNNFIIEVERLLSLLIKHKHLCPSSQKKKGLRKCVISKQTSLIYRITEPNRLELVTFIDNRSEHAY